MGNRNRVLSTYLDSLYKIDYKERPVNIDVFIEDTYFLGKITSKGNTIYPCWRNFLRELFSDNRIHIGILSGAIGTGKTYVAYLAASYVIYRILSLKNPWEFFDLASGAKMAVAFFNLTRTLGSSKGYMLLNAFLKSSPWFINEGGGHLKGKNENETIHFPLLEWVLASPYSHGFGQQGESILLAIMDELDDPNESVGQKKRIIKAFDSTRQRFNSRFVIDGESLGKLILVASKQDELSFLNVFIDKMKNDESVLIYDIARWEAKPDSHYSGKKFYVALGDAFNQSKVLNGVKEIPAAVECGYQILPVPVEFEKDFRSDLIGSLRDIAGIAVLGTRKNKFVAAERFITDCMDKKKKNPLSVETIHIGLDSPEELIHYIDLDKITNSRSTPRFIHLDIALSGDALGLGMSGIGGWKIQDVQNEDGTFTPQKMPIIETDFAMRIKAKPNDEIPIFKVRKLVLDLIQRGFRIAQFSADLRLASADTFQILKKKDIATKYISLDKTPKYHNDFKQLLLESRWTTAWNNYLYFELRYLEWNKETQKVDHPAEVKEIFIDEGVEKEIILVGSKDVSDGVIGSVGGALEYANTHIDSGLAVKAMENAMKSISIPEDDMSWILGIDKKRTKEDSHIIQHDSKKSAEDLFNDILKRSR